MAVRLIILQFPFFYGEVYYFGSMKQAWYNRKWIIILFHAAAWITLYSLPFLLKPSSYDKNSHDQHENHHWVLYGITCTLWTASFYLNAYALIRRFMNKKRYLQFILLQVAAFIVMVMVSWSYFQLFGEPREHNIRMDILVNIFPFLFMLACSIAYQNIEEKIVTDRLVKEKENENLKTELSFLRSQVSPHFMFNVLNNMVALARKRSEQLEPSLIKLSSLMRYMLYEANEDKVPLEKEIEYLQSYIDLQQQRFGSKVTVNVLLDVADNDCEIEPMLLIPFVENAFKHGTGLVEDAFITIELNVRNNLLQFTVRNKYNNVPNEVKDKTSGIGLVNVKRRLNLLYGNHHTLLITTHSDFFVVSLQLNLH